MLISAVIKRIKDDLSPFYSQEEIKGFISLIFEHLLGLSRLQVHLQQHEQISEAKLTEFKEIVDRLKNFEPIQYILGETEFYGLRFKVNPSVLIPRPETEELVDWVLKDYQNNHINILDIGSGSGCIPIALAKNLTHAEIEGWDISEEALTTARENALINNVRVHFDNRDILKWQTYKLPKLYDIIISNPPYVTLSEKESMLPNVTEHEPHLALFVPDQDPLVFYRKISDFALCHLNPGGQLYFEINEKLGIDLEILLTSKSFKDIQLKKDINGRDRMIRCTIKNGEH
jgi:release factor glutamine methyltransferase